MGGHGRLAGRGAPDVKGGVSVMSWVLDGEHTFSRGYTLNRCHYFQRGRTILILLPLRE